jgi:hypothetical protein
MRTLRHALLGLLLGSIPVLLCGGAAWAQGQETFSAGDGGAYDASVCNDPSIPIMAAQQHATPYHDPNWNTPGDPLREALGILAQKYNNPDINRAGACEHAPGVVYMVPTNLIPEVTKLIGQIETTQPGGNNIGSGGTPSTGQQGGPNGTNRNGQPAGGRTNGGNGTPGPGGYNGGPANRGGPGFNDTPRLPGPAGGVGYQPGANPCLPSGPGGYDYCNNGPGARLPPGCYCASPAPIQGGVQKDGGRGPAMQAGTGVLDPCKHFRAPYNNKFILKNAQDLAQQVFDNYGTGRPIEIAKVSNRTNTYMVILAGTEFGPGQANMVNAANPFQPLTDMFTQAFQKGLNANPKIFAQNLSDLLGQRQFMSTVVSLLRTEVAASQGRQTMYQADVVRAVTQQIPRGANIIFVGHSLGGMTAENLLRNLLLQKSYNPIQLITFGSPVTQAPVPGVRYVRYSSPTDVVRLASTGSWIVDPSQWIYVNNPGQNPTLAQFFQSTAGAQQRLLQTIVDGAMAAHLKYTISPDLAQYNVLDGTKNTSTTLLLDASDDHCFDAPNVLPELPAPATPAARNPQPYAPGAGRR